MTTTVRSRIVKIGNSQGIRIPKLLLEQANLVDEVELQLEDNQLIVRPVAQARANWEKAFRAMAEQGDDQLLEESVLTLTYWEEEEWEW